MYSGVLTLLRCDATRDVFTLLLLSKTFYLRHSKRYHNYKIAQWGKSLPVRVFVGWCAPDVSASGWAVRRGWLRAVAAAGREGCFPRCCCWSTAGPAADYRPRRIPCAGACCGRRSAPSNHLQKYMKQLSNCISIEITYSSMLNALEFGRIREKKMRPMNRFQLFDSFLTAWMSKMLKQAVITIA